MPFYEYLCAKGHQFGKFSSLAEHRRWMPCETCGVLAEQIICAPILVVTQPECRYDSPVTGEPITSWAQRQNDLAKHNCQPYDPEMKTDYMNRMQEGERALDENIDQTVEAAWEKMPTAKRNQLASELVERGTDLICTRGTK